MVNPNVIIVIDQSSRIAVLCSLLKHGWPHPFPRRTPVLVLHGDGDVDVPCQQIPPLVAALGRSPHPGASVESHFYAGEGHGIAGTVAQADYLDRIRTFLRINMKPWDFTDNPHVEVTAY